MKTLALAHSGNVALVDDEDYERLACYKWYDKTKVIQRNSKCGSISLASVVMRQWPRVFDHRDRNYLNNQKSNLRLCTHQQNCFNRSKHSGTSSKYLGVIWNKATSCWYIQIKINGKKRHIGRTTNELEGALLYDAQARILFGEFARPNFKIT